MNRRALIINTICGLTVIILGVGPSAMTVHAQTDDPVVARINDRKITLKEVDNSVISQVMPLQEKSILNFSRSSKGEVWDWKHNEGSEQC